MYIQYIHYKIRRLRYQMSSLLSPFAMYRNSSACFKAASLSARASVKRTHSAAALAAYGGHEDIGTHTYTHINLSSYIHIHTYIHINTSHIYTHTYIHKLKVYTYIIHTQIYALTHTYCTHYTYKLFLSLHTYIHTYLSLLIL